MLDHLLSPGRIGPLDLRNRIHEHTLVSDSAKQGLYRERECELLCELIESRIGEGQFGTAHLLCEELVRLGWPGEVETLQARIAQGEQTQVQEQIGGTDAAPAPQLSPEAEAKLRALGYVP